MGYDNIDVLACTERGITATNDPGVLTEATADIAFGLILMATRRLGEDERLIRAGQPRKWGMFFLLGSSLQGKTLGIVGQGGIGQATARNPAAKSTPPSPPRNSQPRRIPRDRCRNCRLRTARAVAWFDALGI